MNITHSLLKKKKTISNEKTNICFKIKCLKLGKYINIKNARSNKII